MIKLLTAATLAFSLLFTGATGLGFIPQSSSPATQAVVAILNIVDPHLIMVSSNEGASPSTVAQNILVKLVEGNILASDLSMELQVAMDDALVSRTLLILFLADVSNGTAKLATRDPAQLEASLTEAGIKVPAGQDGQLNQADITTLISNMLNNSSQILASVRARYNSPVE